ncbi:hypothetical protein HHK36_031522 [Tetracentron sinense]|uniref:non-specific serine/threonine protein kinase n=1 Tax=Tetracentron sinense TaxID=13715 RepID=A0A834Y6S0_TETSI|nr:hypothetical protein HHK36_031522 [Tetracentron sinense]
MSCLVQFLLATFSGKRRPRTLLETQAYVEMQDCPVVIPVLQGLSTTRRSLLLSSFPLSDFYCWGAIIVGILILCRKSKHCNEEMEITARDVITKPLIWEREGKFTFGDIAKATEDFNEIYCIGKGGFGSVYKAVLPTGQIVAVKRLHLSDSSDIPAINRRSFENEIGSLTEVRHRNIIKLYGFCSKKGFMYLVYEYVERGSLRKVLYGEEGGSELNWVTRVNIIQGVAHATAYLHHDCSPPIVHRDISANNILLETGFEPLLSDFGTARLLSSDSSNWTTVAGPMATWLQSLHIQFESRRSVMFISFGVVALEVMMGRHPGELISSLSSWSSGDRGLTIEGWLDQRLPPPTGQLAEEVVL